MLTGSNNSIGMVAVDINCSLLLLRATARYASSSQAAGTTQAAKDAKSPVTLCRSLLPLMLAPAAAASVVCAANTAAFAKVAAAAATLLPA